MLPAMRRRQHRPDRVMALIVNPTGADAVGTKVPTTVTLFSVGSSFASAHSN